MFKFLAGFAAATLLYKNSPKIVQKLEYVVAKLEMRRDILKHDNPELRESGDDLS